MLVSGLEMREDRPPFAIRSCAQFVMSTVLGAPVTFVERGVGRAFGRTEAFPDASVVSVVLAQAAALVRTIYVVRKELAVPGRLAYRLAGLHRKRAVDLCGNQSPSTPSTLCSARCCSARRGASDDLHVLASCHCPDRRRLPRRFVGRGQGRGPGRLA